ncbi:MAG: DUF6476 family protein [Alphaproteobacteria bacterium]
MNAPGRHASPTPGTGLKVLVIVMGLMIAAGLAVLGVTIVKRATDADLGAGSDYATATIALPAHARILAMTGAGDAITLLIETTDRRHALVTLDRKTGAVLGTLTLGNGAE